MQPKQAAPKRWFVGTRLRFQQPYQDLLIEWEMMLPKMAEVLTQQEIAIHNACIADLRQRLELT